MTHLKRRVLQLLTHAGYGSYVRTSHQLAHLGRRDYPTGRHLSRNIRVQRAVVRRGLPHHPRRRCPGGVRHLLRAPRRRYAGRVCHLLRALRIHRQLGSREVRMGRGLVRRRNVRHSTRGRLLELLEIGRHLPVGGRK
jgi:hypothetical protein